MNSMTDKPVEILFPTQLTTTVCYLPSYHIEKAGISWPAFYISGSCPSSHFSLCERLDTQKKYTPYGYLPRYLFLIAPKIQTKLPNISNLGPAYQAHNLRTWDASAVLNLPIFLSTLFYRNQCRAAKDSQVTLLSLGAALHGAGRNRSPA